MKRIKLVPCGPKARETVPLLRAVAAELGVELDQTDSELAAFSAGAVVAIMKLYGLRSNVPEEVDLGARTHATILALAVQHAVEGSLVVEGTVAFDDRQDAERRRN